MTSLIDAQVWTRCTVRFACVLQWMLASIVLGVGFTCYAVNGFDTMRGMALTDVRQLAQARGRSTGALALQSMLDVYTLASGVAVAVAIMLITVRTTYAMHASRRKCATAVTCRRARARHLQRKWSRSRRRRPRRAAAL